MCGLFQSWFEKPLNFSRFTFGNVLEIRLNLEDLIELQTGMEDYLK